MADKAQAQRPQHRRPAFVMTVYQDVSGEWLFRLKSLRDGHEQVVRDVQELMRVLETLSQQGLSGRKENHAQA